MPAFCLTVALVGDPTGKANGYKESLYIPWSERVQAHLHVPWSATVGEVRRNAAHALGLPAGRDYRPDLAPVGSDKPDDLAWYENLDPLGDFSTPVVDDLGLARWPSDDVPYRYWLNARAVGITRYVDIPGRAYLVIAEPDSYDVIEDPPPVFVEWPDFQAAYERLGRVVASVARDKPGTWQGGAAANVVRFVSVLGANVDTWTALGADPYALSDLLRRPWETDVLRRLLDLDAGEAEDVLRAMGYSLHGENEWQAGGSKAAYVNSAVLTDVLGGMFPDADKDVRARWDEVIEGVRKSDPLYVPQPLPEPA